MQLFVDRIVLFDIYKKLVYAHVLCGVVVISEYCYLKIM